MDAFPGDPDEYLDSDGDGFADGKDDCPESGVHLRNAELLTCGGQVESAQAQAGARRAALHRRDNPRRVSAVHREGCGF